jgi:enamine deaminase RidA (YjgF/YER057c/UK114 family)
MSAIKRLHAGPRMSQIVIHGNTVYLAGQVAENTAADAEGQTREILASIDSLLAEAGSDKTKILSAMIFVTDMRLFSAMNKVWDAWVPAGHTPARATVAALLATPQHLVEIKIIAAL